MKLGLLVPCLAIIACGGDAFTTSSDPIDGAHVLVDAGDEVLDEGHQGDAPSVALDSQGAEQVLDGEDGHADGGPQRDASRDERDAGPGSEQSTDALVDAPLMICVSYQIPCPTPFPLQCCHSSPCVCCTQATTSCP